MLFKATLRKELGRSFTATFIVLTSVVMTLTLIRTLGQAAKGSFDVGDTLLVMGYTILAYTPTLLSMSILISIIGTITRMFVQSEMVIWQSSGQALTSFIGPCFRFCWPIIILIAALTMFFLPWSNENINNLKNNFQARGDLDRIQPGIFRESSNGEKVFFTENSFEENKNGRNVFIVSHERGLRTLTTAIEGKITKGEEDNKLILYEGQRLEQSLKESNLKISDFKEYGVVIETIDNSGKFQKQINALATFDLLSNPNNSSLSELAWRFGLVMASINLVFIGVASSVVRPRTGRGVNFGFGLFSFIIYYNLILISRDWIFNGRLGFWEALITIHGGILLITLILLIKINSGWMLISLIKIKIKKYVSESI